MLAELKWALRRRIVRWLWANKRDWLLDLRGLKNHAIHGEEEFLDLFNEIYNEGRTLLSIREMYNIYDAVKRVSNVEGDIAEVGVYKGGSARLIAAVKGDKRLHLFDTFEGMPQVNRQYDRYNPGDFGDTSMEGVRAYLDRSGAANVLYYKGLFPDSARGHEHELTRLALVNLDVDLYQSTRSGLEFFYPRLASGGILISHDYRALSCPGVKQAFDEFLADKPEKAVPIWDTQCFFVKG